MMMISILSAGNNDAKLTEVGGYRPAAGMIISCLMILVPTLLKLWIKLRSARYDRDRDRLLPLPPGSSGWPILGETLDFIGRSNTSFALGTLSPFFSHRAQRYGKLFRTHLFGMPTVVSADAELNKLLLLNEGKLVECSYPSTFRAILGDGAMVMVHGDLHKRMRSIALAFMSPAKLRDSFLDDVQDVALWILSSWTKQNIVFAETEARNFTFNLTALKLLSFRPGHILTEQMFHGYNYFFEGLYSLPIDLPGTPYRRALKERAQIKKIIEIEMQKRLQSIKDVGDRDDFLDAMLGDLDEHGQPMSKDLISDLIIALFLAGHETTASVITVAIKLLMEHPDALQEIKAEHESIRGSKQVNEKLSWDDYKAMQFTQHVINETIRLASPIDAIQRKALQDIHVKGFRVIGKDKHLYLHMPA